MAERDGSCAHQALHGGAGQSHLRRLSGRGGGIHPGNCQPTFLATNATVEGQTTAHYITDRLEGCGVNISRLAHGVPVGGELDYLDDGTLTAAMKSRRPF